MFIEFQRFSITEILRINLAAIVIDQHLVSKFYSHELIMEILRLKALQGENLGRIINNKHAEKIVSFVYTSNRNELHRRRKKNSLNLVMKRKQK